MAKGRQTHYVKHRERLLRTIDDYAKEHGRPPSLREVAEGSEVSVGAVSGYVRKLADEELVRWLPRAHRSLVVTQRGQELLRQDDIETPF